MGVIFILSVVFLTAIVGYLYYFDYLTMYSAIMIDGPFFLRRIREIFPAHIHYDHKLVADLVWRLSAAHLYERNQPKRHLYRIFFYDKPVLNGLLNGPIHKDSQPQGDNQLLNFQIAFHRQLQRKRKLAVRLSHSCASDHWKLTQEANQLLLANKLPFNELNNSLFTPDLTNQGFELKMGVDLATLAYKQQVKQVVLIMGDSSFTGAAELLRHEGIDVVLDPMWQDIPEDLFSHVDGLRSTCPAKDRVDDFLSRINSDNDYEST